LLRRQSSLASPSRSTSSRRSFLIVDIGKHMPNDAECDAGERESQDQRKLVALIDEPTAIGRILTPVTRVLEQLAASRGLPQVLRTDNGLSHKSRGHSFATLAVCQ
jgi:hypothetical protein